MKNKIEVREVSIEEPFLVLGPAKHTSSISLLNKGMLFYLMRPQAKQFCQNIPASSLMENLYIHPAQRGRERESAQKLFFP